MTVGTVEAGEGVSSVVQQVLEHRQVLHGKHVDGGEGGGMRGDGGIDVGTMLHQHGDGLNAALPCRHHQRPENVQVGVGTGFQQHACCVNIVVDDREVERRATAVLVQLRSFLRQLCVDIEACLDQILQDIVTVTLSSQVERANAGSPNSGLTCGRD